MKQTVKKLIAALAIIAVAATTTVGVFAEDEGINPISAPISVPANAIAVNGTLLEASTYVNESGIMVPIRATAEAMGFTVEWDNGTVILSRGPVYATLAIGVDGYTFAKTAPMPLGQAPELVDEKTYVPAAFFTEILDAKLVETAEDGAFAITYGEEEEPTEGEDPAEGEGVEAGSAVIVEITEDGVLVKDDVWGEVLLHVSEDTEIVLLDGEKGTVEDLEAAMAVEIEYGPAMTMSIPPQNTPVKITVVEREVSDEDMKLEEKTPVVDMEGIENSDEADADASEDASEDAAEDAVEE